MKTKMKAILTLLLTLVMGVTTSAAASQGPTAVDVYYVPMHFTFDGKEYAPPAGQRGFIYEGSSYVPLRFVSYSLGKSVKWEGDTYTVTVEKPSNSELINISEYNLNTEVRGQTIGKVDKSNLKSTSLQVYKQKVAYVFDGQAKQPSDHQPSFIIDGSLYVPIRFLSESVGKKIEWNSDTYTVAAVVKKELKPSLDGTTDKNKADTLKGEGVGGVRTDGVILGGGSPSGGAGAGVGAKPAYESITASAESRLLALKSDCRSELASLFQEYKKTKNGDLIVQGQTKLKACDSKFESIITDISNQLSTNGYSLDVIQIYRNAYEQEKNAALAQLLQSH